MRLSNATYININTNMNIITHISFHKPRESNNTSNKTYTLPFPRGLF